MEPSLPDGHLVVSHEGSTARREPPVRGDDARRDGTALLAHLLVGARGPTAAGPPRMSRGGHRSSSQVRSVRAQMVDAVEVARAPTPTRRAPPASFVRSSPPPAPSHSGPSPLVRRPPGTLCPSHRPRIAEQPIESSRRAEGPGLLSPPPVPRLARVATRSPTTWPRPPSCSSRTRHERPPARPPTALVGGRGRLLVATGELSIGVTDSLGGEPRGP